MDVTTPRRLGTSELLVNPLGFGGGTIGSPFVDTPTAFVTVQTAWETGVRLFDTAPWYGVGRSERRLGMALGDMNVPREEFAVNTKIGKTLNPEPIRDESNKTYCVDGSVRTPRDSRTGFRVEFDYTATGFQKQHRESRQRLGLSSVDTLTIHDIDYGYHTTEQLEDVFQQLDSSGGDGVSYLEEIKQRGQIKALGAGCNLESRNALSWETSAHEDLIDRLVETVPLDFLIVAGGYTLLENRALRRILPLCDKLGMGVIAATPFAGGWLVDPKHASTYMYGPASEQILEKTLRMESICKQYNIPLPAVALQFQLCHPSVVAVIPGAKHPDEVRANRKLANIDIPSQLWTDLKHEALIDSSAPTPN